MIYPLNLLINKSNLKKTVNKKVSILSQTLKMDSLTKFNKASLGFYNDIIQDFSKKVKEAIPEEYHSAIDELMVSNQKMLDDAKKVNKKMKKKTTPGNKKASSGWNLFFKDNQSSVTATKQKNKMSLVSELWNALSGEEKEEWNVKAKANASTSDSEPQSDAEPQSDTEVSSDTEIPKKKGAKKSPAKKGKKAKKVETPVQSDVDDDMPIMDASD